MDKLVTRLPKDRDVRFVLIAGLVIAILAFTPLRLVSMVAVLLLWTWYWPFSKFQDSWVLRLALAFALFTCSQQLIAMTCWALHVPATVPLVVIVQLVACLALVAARRKAWPAVPVSIIRWKDATALAVAIGSVFAITFGAFHGGAPLQQLLRFVTTGYDNTQHVSLTMTLYENRGHVYGPVADTIEKTIFANMSSYPQGWSMSASLWWHGVTSHLDIQQSPGKVLALYAGMVILWYGLLVFLLCRLILQIAEIMRGKANGVAGYVGAIAFTCLVQLLFLVGLLTYGFASFYPALVLPLVLTFLLIELLQDRRNDIAPARFLIGGVMLAAGMSFSWLLSAPVAFIMVALGLAQHFVSWRAAWLWARKHWLAIVLAVVLVGIASLQGVIQLLYGVKDLVNVPGGITPINKTVVFVVLLASLGMVAYGSNKPVKNLFVVATSGAMMIAGAIFLFQVVSSGQATYFSVKISIVAMLLIFAFFAAAVLVLVQDRMAGKNWLHGTALIMGLVLFMPITSGMALGTGEDGLGSVNYIKGERYMAPVTAGVLSDLIVNKHAVNANVIVYRQQSYPEDIQGTHFMDVLPRHEISACRGGLEQHLVAGWSVSPDELKACAGKDDVYLVVAAKGYSQSLVDYADTPNIKVVLAY
jgi:hypothetical protein